MKNYLFMNHVIRFVSEGRLLSRTFAGALRIFAAIIAIAALVAWLGLWRIVFTAPGTGIVGGILFQFVYFIGIYMVTHLMVIRAGDIASIDGSDFVVLRMVSTFLRANGEVVATVSACTGLGVALLVLFGGNDPLAYEMVRAIPMFGSVVPKIGDSNFVSALVVLVVGAVAAVFWLSVYYLFAELVSVFVEIALNTRRLRAEAPPAAPGSEAA